MSATPDGEVTAIVEKPDPATAPSTLAVTARYAMTPAIFDAIRETPPDGKGEVGLSQAIALLLERGERVRAVPLPPGVVRHDIGTHESYSAAFLRFALADPTYGERLRALLERMTRAERPRTRRPRRPPLRRLRRRDAQRHAAQLPRATSRLSRPTSSTSRRPARTAGPRAASRSSAPRSRASSASAARLPEPVQIRYRSTIPREVGLGGSSAIVIATLRALAAAHADRDRDRARLPALALAVETEELASRPASRTASCRPTAASSSWTSSTTTTSRSRPTCSRRSSSPTGRPRAARRPTAHATVRRALPRRRRAGRRRDANPRAPSRARRTPR